MLAVLTLILDIFRLGFQLFRPNGKSSLMAECILLRQQLLLVKRKQCRAPNLTTLNRIVFAITIPFIKSTRLPRLSIVIAHSTLLRIHKALVERKYSMLFSNKNRKPGPKGPSPELIKLIIEIKQKNPKYGCPRIALLASKLTDRAINENLFHPLNSPKRMEMDSIASTPSFFSDQNLQYLPLNCIFCSAILNSG